MATQVMSPYVLLQEMAKLRRANAPYNVDPYGLTAAMRGVGSDYDAMNKSVVGANQAQLSSLSTQQHLDMAQAVEAGHAAAAAAGLDAGSPEYDQFMNHYLSMHGNYQAALSTVKGAKAAQTELQNRAFAQSIVKKGVEAELVKRTALGIFNEMKATGGGEGSKLFNEKAAMPQALAMAQKQIADAGVNVALNHDGIVTASDNAGNNIVIEPQMAAVGMLAMGNNAGEKAYKYLGSEYQTALSNKLKEQEEARKLAAAGGTGATSAKSGKPDPFDVRTMLMDNLKHLRTLDAKYIGKENLTPEDKASRDKLEKQIDDAYQELRQAYGIGTGGAVDNTNSAIKRADQMGGNSTGVGGRPPDSYFGLDTSAFPTDPFGPAAGGPPTLPGAGVSDAPATSAAVDSVSSNPYFQQWLQKFAPTPPITPEQLLNEQNMQQYGTSSMPAPGQ